MLTHIDVSSMYPWMLRERRYPVARRATLGQTHPDALRDLLRSYGVIARVRLRSEIPEYPVRRGDRTIYPVGEYTTTLAGPDLACALEEGSVVSCDMAAVYVMGEPFRGAMEALLGARAEAEAAGDRAGAVLAKLLANSLAGRLAMREGGWQRRPDMDVPGLWGEHYRLSSRHAGRRRYRHLAGIAWEWVEDRLPRGPHTSAFAYLTAYGRVHMRHLRAVCPARSVVSQDTDGLWLLPSAVDALAAMDIWADAGPGSVRVTDTADTGEWWGPRHYRAGSKWVLAGFRGATFRPEIQRIEHSSHTPMLIRDPRRPPSEVAVHTYWTQIPDGLIDGVVQPDGWILPRRIIPHRAGQE